MGVPKFFRYISERYPCLSEIVKEYQIPEFDNMYLDMNGIIHICSHPDDADPHFRISVEKIFEDIFHYIEVLFRMIKPRKLFFMAVDGVAPRAKMNQQRARRFRSAKEAEKMEEKARKKGEVLPEEARFDSNCITPGTTFMADLHEQLKYFVVQKISNDKLWQKCKIILSGQETPGEGEHKIMDYIRYLRSQPGYDPNTRHCLYGLDADLIMLGLCTHEPHFSLLREEVKFGRKSTKSKSSPEQINFFLLHLSLMREYLELEFKELDDKKLPFGFDVDKIIDDWVLMGFLVGNDFIPNLPNLHITNGALPLLYKTYMQVLPSFDGYINEAGTLHLGRFEKFMEALANIDLENFQDTYADLKYFEEKTGRRPNETERKSYKFKDPEGSQIDEESNLIQFDDLKSEKPRNSELEALIKDTEDMFLERSETNFDPLKITENGDDLDDIDLMDSDESDYMFQKEFKQHKRDYYMNKLQYGNVTSEVLQSQAEGYVRAIQWNLNYYYNGVCSWSWYYPHHYAPYISDIKGFADLKLEFELGKPFRPYEQLLAVLPAASKELLPKAYQNLMTDSPISEYYPEDFQTDLNGKKQEWEAVALIPFIDEYKLLQAMEPCELLLTPEEIKRNSHGPMLIYSYTSSNLGTYEAPEYFPPVVPNHASCISITIEEIRVPKEKLVKGPYPGVKTDVYYPGFPTLKHLKFVHALVTARVKVHEQCSRGENMILTIKNDGSSSIDEVARNLLGRTVFVAWPHLVEALVVCVSDLKHQYKSTGTPGSYNVEDNTGNLTQNWEAEKSGIEEYYKTRFGIEVGKTDILIHVRVMTGKKYVFTLNGRITLEKQWASVTSAYPLQSIVRSISVHDDLHSSFRDIESVFPVGSVCFMLGHPHYGSLGEVKDSKESLRNNRIKVNMKSYEEPVFDDIKEFEKDVKIRYMNLYKAASRLAISKNLFTRITGSILVSMHSKLNTMDDTNKVNIGLNLKFSKKNEEVPGYTRREDNVWYYSEKALNLVKAYSELCPELFEYLNIHNSNVYFVDDLFPNQNGKEKIDQILSWIKNQPFYSLERRSCGSMMLDLDVVKELEETVDNFNQNNKCKNILMQVKPHLLYKSDISIGNIAPDPSATYQLYDRVVNIRESYTVPLGLRGTIIAIHKSNSDKESDFLYDVVFDEPFVGGQELGCSPKRGYRLPKVAVINKSYGLREYMRKTCNQGKPTNYSKSELQNSIGHDNSANAMRMPWSQNSAFATCYYPPHAQHNFMPQRSPNLEYMMIPNQQFQKPALRQQVTGQHTKRVTQSHFLPAFATNEAKPNTTRLEQNSRSYHQDNKPGSNSPKQPQQQNKKEFDKAPKVNTDFLKKILKIDNPTSSASEIEKPTEDKKLTVNDIFSHAKRKNAQSEPKPTYRSVQLLHYYQANGFGCPHYSYFNLPDNTIQAQLINPISKRVVCGTPSANKTEACENVAAEVLNLIMQNTRSSDCVDVENKKPSQTTSKAPAEDTVKKFPFTPLQAVVQHITKNVKQSGSEKTTEMRETQCISGDSIVESDVSSNGAVQSKHIKNTNACEESTTMQKPRRERKMRIAANFQIKPAN